MVVPILIGLGALALLAANGKKGGESLSPPGQPPATIGPRPGSTVRPQPYGDKVPYGEKGLSPSEAKEWASTARDFWNLGNEVWSTFRGSKQNPDA